MKIICVDNFDREAYSDSLICTNICKIYGEYLVNCLNNKYGGEQSPDYFKLVEDDYKLYKFEP
jgi:hypothetical protein